MTHWLDRMLSPKSVAIVGASERDGNLAGATIRQLQDTGYGGKLLLINPNYEALFDLPCYPTLSSLPENPDLVVFAISGLALEQSFNEALSIGVGGIVMYASNVVEEDTNPPLTQRLRDRAARAGIPVCGGNSMGFYNYDHNVMISFDRPPASRPSGHIGLIAHSGSAMTYLANNDARFCYNYVISSGQETHADVADYMDYLLDQLSTRVVALFIETIRDAPGFVASLEKAQNKNIPVVVTKLGRTDKSAALALSHSGAIVGNHDAFASVCRRYGAIICNDIDELIITAMLFAMGYRTDSGGVAGLLDSGGMREQMIDLAEDYGVRFAEVSEQTLKTMQSHLEYGLHADNPLDGMGSLGRNTEQTYLECGKALLDDANTGLLTYEFEFRDDFTHYPVMFDVIDQLNRYSEKPLIVINSCAYTALSDTAARLSRQGIAMINGIDVALRSIRNLYQYKGIKRYTKSEPADQLNPGTVGKWKTILTSTDQLDEMTSLELAADFGLPVIPHASAHDLSSVITSANQIGYPVALKTAANGILHKSDAGGVKLSIHNDSELAQEYDELQQR
ncbi:MAG: acetate--CoA ligase family protein, partial [Gammaproteobacteria bacterium]